MEQRKLTVYEGRGKNYAAIPQIILQGKWLEQMGYNVGDKVIVDCQADKIIIKKMQPSSEQGD